MIDSFNISDAIKRNTLGNKSDYINQRKRGKKVSFKALESVLFLSRFTYNKKSARREFTFEHSRGITKNSIQVICEH